MGSLLGAGNTRETIKVRSFCYEPKESGRLKGRARHCLVSNAPLQAGESLSALSEVAIISMAFASQCQRRKDLVTSRRGRLEPARSSTTDQDGWCAGLRQTGVFVEEKLGL